jgi:hypothetical protein
MRQFKHVKPKYVGTQVTAKLYHTSGSGCGPYVVQISSDSYGSVGKDEHHDFNTLQEAQEFYDNLPEDN